MLLDAKYDKACDRWQVNLYGEIDIYNAESMKSELYALIEEKGADIILNCASLKYIDSTGLGVLVSTLKRVREADKRISITNLKPYIAKIFTLTGLNKVFEIGVSGQ